MLRSKVPQQRTVFQAFPLPKPITLDQVHDMFIASKTMSLANKREYAYSEGIDYDNASKYYQTVQYLERCLRKKT